jgi:hypothetical protein
MKTEVTDLDAVLAGRRKDLSGIELDGGYRVVVLERLEHAASPQIPYLRISHPNRQRPRS